MGDAISMDKPRNGEAAWISCHCQPEPTPMVAIGLVQENPVITALVCPECMLTVPVENGYPNLDGMLPGGSAND